MKLKPPICDFMPSDVECGTVPASVQSRFPSMFSNSQHCFVPINCLVYPSQKALLSTLLCTEVPSVLPPGVVAKFWWRARRCLALPAHLIRLHSRNVGVCVPSRSLPSLPSRFPSWFNGTGPARVWKALLQPHSATKKKRKSVGVILMRDMLAWLI